MAGIIQSRALSELKLKINMYLNNFDNENKNYYFSETLKSIKILLDTFELAKWDPQK
ncbi:MAG: hypothetical protein V1663_02005 [archaeon]